MTKLERLTIENDRLRERAKQHRGDLEDLWKLCDYWWSDSYTLRAACELFVKYDSGLFDDVDDIRAYAKANDAIRKALKEQPFE